MSSQTKKKQRRREYERERNIRRNLSVRGTDPMRMIAKQNRKLDIRTSEDIVAITHKGMELAGFPWIARSPWEAPWTSPIPFPEVFDETPLDRLIEDTEKLMDSLEVQFVYRLTHLAETIDRIVDECVVTKKDPNTDLRGLGNRTTEAICRSMLYSLSNPSAADPAVVGVGVAMTMISLNSLSAISSQAYAEHNHRIKRMIAETLRTLNKSVPSRPTDGS